MHGAVNGAPHCRAFSVAHALPVGVDFERGLPAICGGYVCKACLIRLTVAPLVRGVGYTLHRGRQGYLLRRQQRGETVLVLEHLRVRVHLHQLRRGRILAHKTRPVVFGVVVGVICLVILADADVFRTGEHFFTKVCDSDWIRQ